MQQTPVLVLGSGLTPIGVMRSLHRAGIPTYDFDVRHDIEHHSRWYRPAPLRGDLHEPVLEELLDALELESAVLMPCSDHWASQVAALPSAQRARWRASIASPDVIRLLVDKDAFAGVLREAGVPHPVTRAVGNVRDLEALPPHVFDGAFLKPHDSQPFFARFGVKAFRVGSRAEAVARMAEVEEAGLQVLLQEYVPGPGHLHYYVEGFVDAHGALAAVFARNRVRMYPPDFGNSTYMVSVPPAEVAPAIDAMRTLLAHIGFRGIFSAEFKRDPRDGRFKLIEVNARPWWYVEFAARCGVDVCTMAYRDALGLPVAPVAAYRVGVRMVYPYYDLPACRDAYRAGDLTALEWARSWVGAQQPLFNWSDPAPAFAEAWQTLGRRTLRQLGFARRG